MANLERHCTVLLHPGSTLPPKESDYAEMLEKGSDKEKIEALKAIIMNMLNGETYTKLMMCIIKFTLHSKNHTIKKLLLIYWEVVDKKKPDGTLLTEMILVCNAMKANLDHPNEYIRGSTLRFLCKMKEAEILESLIPSITENLEHRHSYVRKNAVLTVYTIYSAFSELIPDAPELIQNFLYAENNPCARRNAFLMLFQCNQDLAVEYLNSIITTIGSYGESFQLVVLELIRKVCRTNPLAKSQYIRCIYDLVNGSSNAVAFEGANTLVALSTAPTAVRAAVTAYTTLLAKESDNNVKLIILGRLDALRKKHEKVLQEMLMDIMRTLSTPNIDIQKKTLDLCLQLISPRNVEQVVQLLKKEIVRTNASWNNSDQYRKLLVDAMHRCAIKFPEVVSSVVQVLMNYLGDENGSAGLDVVHFIREVVAEYPKLRESILEKLMHSFDMIQGSEVYRVALWILAEYAADAASLEHALLTIRTSVGPLPLANAVEAETEVKEGEADEDQPSSKPVILADGTYGSQSAAESNKMDKEPEKPVFSSHLRQLLLDGDFFLGASLSSSLTKLLRRYASLHPEGTQQTNEEVALGLLTMTSLLRLEASAGKDKKMDKDSRQHIKLCIQVLLNPGTYGKMFASECRHAFTNMLEEDRKHKAGFEKKEETKEVLRQADDLISIRQLKGTQHMDLDLMDDEADLNKAVGTDTNTSVQRLNRVYQLTGFADPVYVEAHLSVMEYDIVLDILVANQTEQVLQNLSVELNTSGDLKVVERPQSYTIRPNGSTKIQASIKVSSTESGVIFGNVVYDSAHGTQKTIVVLNNIHMDIMDYIQPSVCELNNFRKMWAEFEWENKVAVNTDIIDLNMYLNHLLKITNMGCMTPESTRSGTCAFLAANLYARSMFGEDALLNLSIERQATGKIIGFIRIRSKSQGIALSLGDKVTAHQRNAEE